MYNEVGCQNDLPMSARQTAEAERAAYVNRRIIADVPAAMPNPSGSVDVRTNQVQLFIGCQTFIIGRSGHGDDVVLWSPHAGTTTISAGDWQRVVVALQGV